MYMFSAKLVKTYDINTERLIILRRLDWLVAVCYHCVELKSVSCLIAKVLVFVVYAKKLQNVTNLFSAHT